MSDEEQKYTLLGDADQTLRPFLTAIEEWIYPELRTAWDNAQLPDGQHRLCLGVLVYGSYVDRFLQLCVPSLLATGNIKSLYDPMLVIHTNASSVSKLTLGLAELTKYARIEIHVIPNSILSKIKERTDNIYWLLGSVINLHLHQAKYRAHAYHMLMPDHFYATNYFSNLDRLRKEGHVAIVQGAVSTHLEGLAPVLMQANCTVSAPQLNVYGSEYLHPHMAPFVMNGRSDTDYPSSLLLIMFGKEATHLFSPHMTPVYLSHDLLMKVPIRLFNTLDAQLPYYIPDDIEPYVPTANDGMSYIELSEGNRPVPWQARCKTIEEFCARFWLTGSCVQGYERFFNLTTVLPYPKDYIQPRETMSQQEIIDLQNRLRNAVSKSHSTVQQVVPERWRGDPIEWIKNEIAKAA